MSTNRRGEPIQTFTGLQFWPLDPRPEDINILDIAHPLAMQCRFNGHVREYYSVAQHSVLVSRIVPPEDALWGLLHDAAEAYVGDMVRPLKRSGWMENHLEAEARVQAAICARYGLPLEMPASVKEADNRLLMTERRDLMSKSAAKWFEAAEPLSEQIRPWSQATAEAHFLDAFESLTSESA